MPALEPIIFVAGALIVAAISSAVTAAYYRHRAASASKAAWKSAELFFTRRAHDHLTRRP